MDFTVSLTYDFPNDQWLATVRCQRFPIFEGGAITYGRIQCHVVEKTEAEARSAAERRGQELIGMAQTEYEKAGVCAPNFCEEEE